MSEDAFLPLKALCRSRESTLWFLYMHEHIKKYCKLNWRQIFALVLFCCGVPAALPGLNKACFSILHGVFLP